MEDQITLIQRALEEGPFSIRALAEDAGISYDSLYSWARGRRTPKPENLRQVADGFDRRAERLKELAEELRKAAK
jgi:transcriptional regulator with XRE-family HTH domain